MDRELKFIAVEGADETKLDQRAEEIRRWMENFDHNSNMYEGIGFRSDAFSVSFSFFVTMTTEMGIRYCYKAEITRNKTRLKANWDTRQSKAEDGAEQPAIRYELESENRQKPQPESEGRSR